MIRKILSLILCSMLIFPTTGHAVVGVPDSTHWVGAFFGGGGRYSMIVPDNTTANKIYAVSDVGAPYVTIDKGEAWTWLSYNSANGWNGSQPTAIVQSKQHPALMYAISGNSSGLSTGAILKSTDSGATWVRKSTAKASRTSSGKVLAFDPTNDHVIYAGLDNGTILRSTDEGATWPVYFTPFGTNKKAAWIYVSPDGNKIWVGGTNLGVVVYDVATDVQTTVTLTGTLAAYSADYDTYVDGLSAENLCIATGPKVACTNTPNSGASATLTYTAVTTGTANYYNGRVAVSYSSGTVNMVTFTRLTTSGQGGSLEKYSNDGGATWTTATVSKNTTMNPMSILSVGGRSGASMAHDPFDPTVFYYTTDSAIYRSDNSGATFAEKDVGAYNMVHQDITISPNGIIFTCSMDFGCQRSADNGVTWTQVLPISNSNIGHHWRIICAGNLADWQAGTGIVVATTTRYTQPTATNYRNIPARSTDNGLTFTYITAGFPTVGMYGDIIWDHGYMRSIAKSPTGSTIYVGMDGENCDGDGPGGNAYNCSTNNATGGVFVSHDYGATWARANGGAVVSQQSPRKVYHGLAVDPTNSAHIIMGTFGYNLYNSTNSGATLGYVSAPSPYSLTNYIWNTAFDSVGRPYAVGSSSGPVIYKSITTAYGNANGAYSTWQLMKRFFPTSVTNGAANGILVDPNNDDRIFVSVVEGTGGSATGNRIFVTKDAHNHTNATWYDITGDLPVNGGCNELALNPSEGTQGFLYCAGSGAGVVKLDLADSPTVVTGTICAGCSR